ncbi:MAG: PQQ-dependent sugar dehydrogenase [Gammaproteobacteria bacterium]|jgi:glucose/arabinose dehydrogenase|nr:PQQ-dependent sugar dehydrogenase [Gammaproteobacteria bacterium]
MFSLTQPSPLYHHILLLLTTLWSSGAAAQSFVDVEQSNPGIRVEQLFNNLGVPWGMAFVSPQRMLITERDGQARLLDLQTGSVKALQGLPEIVAEGQGGLLDVVAGPDYKSDGWIYFTYSKPENAEAATTLARARLDDLRLVDWQDLLVTDSATSSRHHFGSRIAFDREGHVFFGVGDRGERHEAQNLENHQGSIMRLNLDGSVPVDNPFLRDAPARAEIWSYGHRNPQGMAYDPLHQRLWSIEHGPRGGDEINRVLPGRNYGWPVISHGKEYWGPIAIGEGTSKAGMEQPYKVYIPSIAPGSLMLYRGAAFPEWQGSLFAGALKLRHLNRISLSANGEVTGEQRLLEDLQERIRAVIQGPEGWIYFSTDSGRILRIRPAS